MSQPSKPDLSDESKTSLLAELDAKDKKAHVLDKQGRYAEAEMILRNNLNARIGVLGLPSDHRDVLNNKSNLASQLKNRRLYAEAEALHRELLETETQLYGLEHPDTISDLNGIAEVLSHSGRYDEAIAMQKQALGLGEKLWGKDGLDYLLIEESMGNTLANRGDFKDAENVLKRVMKGYKVIEDGSGPTKLNENTDDQGHAEGNYLRAMSNLASVLGRMGRSNEAVTMYRTVVEQEKDPLGKAISMGNLAVELKRLEQFHEAEVTMSESLTLMFQCVGAKDRRFESGLEDLKFVLRKQGKNEEADRVCIDNLVSGPAPKL